MAIDRYTPGLVAAKAYTASSTADFEYMPRSGHSKITVFTRPSTDGTVTLYRRAADGTLVSLGTAVAVSGSAEDAQMVDYPLSGSLVARFTDTSGGAGTSTCEFADDGTRQGTVGV